MEGERYGPHNAGISVFLPKCQPKSAADGPYLILASLVLLHILNHFGYAGLREILDLFIAATHVDRIKQLRLGLLWSYLPGGVEHKTL